ncbi:MAG: 4-hydroxy-3-methylbut-2-enyl diphosphate reductase [Chloroherpetonaceae bacterium]|nr:4-hydroxy-3-methylbut-2-enyl diphosphate reductase [Chloroherpetonaceae bacterium]MCS7210251.1 4-hydroxy-3-methylbut-2-enyl diphosphate reductase [Chloroherpetonaceae bacterium]MDW8020702.1 4-hydroxy-3-methylbut-2-enyl diphosphate reductase [Chloroherpetonaceae bacterium]
MRVTVDSQSGFCFGVQFAIEMAESELQETGHLYSLGDIVHNAAEVKRLNEMGLETITREEFFKLRNTRVLIRAHGEPPETYRFALENNIELIDASCPVVLKLQRRAREFYEKGYQIIIYGKKDHAEVIGVNGQCNNEAIVIKHADLSDESELSQIDFSRKTVLLSQTTQDTKGFYQLRDNLLQRFAAKGQAENFDVDSTNAEAAEFLAKDTICRQVSNRDEKLSKFAKQHEVIIFVAGRKSSNGKVLFGVCKEANPRTYFVEYESELQPEWFRREDGSLVESVGVCGATSTPMWQMELVADVIRKKFAPESAAVGSCKAC